MIDTLSRFFVLILGIVLVCGLVFLYLQRNFVYTFLPVGQPPADMPRTEVQVLPAFGEDPALTVWVTQPEAGQPILIYFMGESGVLGVHEPQLRDFANAGFGIAAMAYRGGGGQEGTPSEETLYRDALRVYAGLDTLFGRHVPENDRVIYGYSFGTGLAVRLAAEQPELALLLEAPYTRLCNTNLGMGTILPGCILLRNDAYDNLSRIDKIDAPLLVLHGEVDQEVPFAEGQALFNAANRPKFLERYPSAGHDNMDRFGAVDDAASFIRVLRGAR